MFPRDCRRSNANLEASINSRKSLEDEAEHLRGMLADSKEATERYKADMQTLQRSYDYATQEITNLKSRLKSAEDSNDELMNDMTMLRSDFNDREQGLLEQLNVKVRPGKRMAPTPPCLCFCGL